MTHDAEEEELKQRVWTKMSKLGDFARRIANRNEELYNDCKRFMDRNAELERTLADLQAEMDTKENERKSVLLKMEREIDDVIVRVSTDGGDSAYGGEGKYKLIPMCCVCMSEPVRVVVNECGHLCMCRECAEEVHRTTNVCPLCKGPLDPSILVYFP